MKAKEIRSRFLNFFKNQGHSIVESSSLVPQNDPSLLFTNAGMVQFKDVFLGNETRPYHRATSAQKCVRAGGKHNDLENVGFTARHHTFFEMLGNFSFGDYFKKEAIEFAWNFSTQELKLPRSKLYVSVYKKDDEAEKIWRETIGIEKKRIYRFGEEDNFWAMGETGPCGPCSELFYDRGPRYGCKRKNCEVGCECDRYVEFWNLVFMQFNRDSSGKMSPLPKPSVDTGAGLERIALILQDKESNYETDLFQEIIQEIERLSGRKYKKGSEEFVSFRVIADHARACTFLIGDGVLPSNEGRGYVLRRIMRRAIRHGKNLGFKKPFVYQISKFVIEQMKESYPDLTEKSAFIMKAIEAEEEQFLKTLERGLALLDEETKSLKKGSVLNGEVAFKLYDTYGFPLDLTRVICSEKNIKVDEKGFDQRMEKQRSESRKHWKGSGEKAIGKIYQEVFDDLKKKGKLPKFTGYQNLKEKSSCVALIENGKSVQKTSTKSFEAVFEKTPFYGESGGQTGDQGVISGNHFKGKITDVQKPIGDLIVAQIKSTSGEMAVGSPYTQEVNPKIRNLTARNHTATHLLHWALRRVFGDHVKQAGSLVAPNLLRFDFTHFQALSSKELKEVEDLINEKIWADQPVSKKIMTKDDAIAAGAIAFFGEKYGDQVRVVSVGDFSTELCGGTHVERSSEIHLFKIVSEASVAAGVRRIIAYTSEGAFEYLREKDYQVQSIQDKLKASSGEEVVLKLEKLSESERELRKKLEKTQTQGLKNEVDQLLRESKKIGNARLVSTICKPHSTGVKYLRDLSDQIRQKASDSVIALGMRLEKKVFLLIAAGKSVKNLQSQKIIQEIAPMIEGRGGGKPDLAQAGGTKLNGLEKALSQAESLIQQNLSSN